MNVKPDFSQNANVAATAPAFLSVWDLHAYYGERTHHVAAHDGVRDDRYKLFRFTKTGEWQLFDLKNDPEEMHDISGDPAHAETLERMKALYQEMRTKYEVP